MNIVGIKPIESSIVKSVQDDTSLVWLYFLGVILILLTCFIFGLWHYYSSARYQLKKKLYQDSSSLDLENAINSIFGAKELYDSLKGKCHPDNFSIDSDKLEKATNIFSLLVKNKHDYGALLSLKERARNELNINV